jgi:hypothetical protein
MPGSAFSSVSFMALIKEREKHCKASPMIEPSSSIGFKTRWRKSVLQQQLLKVTMPILNQKVTTS